MASETRLWLAGPNGGAVPMQVPFGAPPGIAVAKIINALAPLFHGRLAAAQLYDGATIAAADAANLDIRVRKNGLAVAGDGTGVIMAGPYYTRLTTIAGAAAFGALTAHVVQDLVAAPTREAALVDNNDNVYIEKGFTGAGKDLSGDARIVLWWVGGWNADPSTNPAT